MEVVKRQVFPLLSQIGINYRSLSLSDHTADHAFRVKAGDRLPYLPAGDESLYHRFRAPKFHLVTIGDSQIAAADSPNDWFDRHAFPLSEEAKESFGATKPFGVLVRPDHYLSAYFSPDESECITAYLQGLARTRP